MYLDETILQSNTTNSLISFIYRLWGSMNYSMEEIPKDIRSDFEEITKLHESAMKKRSRTYRKSELEK